LLLIEQKCDFLEQETKATAPQVAYNIKLSNYHGKTSLNLLVAITRQEITQVAKYIYL